MPLTVVPMRRNSPLTCWPSICEVALRHGADDARDLRRRLHEVADQRVDRPDAGRPAAVHLAQGDALGHPAFASHDPLEAHHLAGQRFVQRDHGVELGGDRAHHVAVGRFAVSVAVLRFSRPAAVPRARAALVRGVEAQPDRKIPLSRRTQRREKLIKRAPRGRTVPPGPSGSGAGLLGGACLRCGRTRLSLFLPRRMQGYSSG
jgi:hypothetical protein